MWSVYLRLPQYGKNSPLSLEVVPLHRWGHSEFTLGVYWTFAAKAEVRADLDKDTFEAVVAHEVAHHVYFKSFNAAKKSVWQAWWDQNVSLMPRLYGQVSASEGWAECFAARFIGLKSYLYEIKKLDPKVIAQVDAMLVSDKEPTYRSLAEWVAA